MTKPLLPPKLGTGAALALAAVLATACADAPRPLSDDGPAARPVHKRPGRFEIRGNLTRPLAPGVSQPLNLRLTNRYRFGLEVKRLTVAPPSTSIAGTWRRAAGCPRTSR